MTRAKDQPTIVYLDPATKKKLRALAKAEGTSLSAVARRMVLAGLKDQ